MEKKHTNSNALTPLNEVLQKRQKTWKAKQKTILLQNLPYIFYDHFVHSFKKIKTEPNIDRFAFLSLQSAVDWFAPAFDFWFVVRVKYKFKCSRIVAIFACRFIFLCSAFQIRLPNTRLFSFHSFNDHHNHTHFFLSEFCSWLFFFCIIVDDFFLFEHLLFVLVDFHKSFRLF